MSKFYAATEVACKECGEIGYHDLVGDKFLCKDCKKFVLNKKKNKDLKKE